MSFLETPRFPDDISYGAAGGPGYATDVVEMNSGYESRNQVWSLPLATYDVAHGVKTQDQLDVLIAFFRNCKGKANGFRFKDWTDCDVDSTTGKLVATGVTDEWQMVKRYTTGALTEDRTVQKPVSGTVAILGGGTYSIDYATGKVTRTAGASPTGWTGEFDVPVRFDIDQMKASIENVNAYAWSQIPLKEVRE